LTAARPWEVSATGLFVQVRLTPKGGRDAVDGIEILSDGRSVLKARVRAAPTDGEANTALVRLLAKTLDVAPRDVNLTTGTTARIKRILINGDAAMLAARLERAWGQHAT
jgi:uncharacterized protein (TIGR00251 family)